MIIGKITGKNMGYPWNTPAGTFWKFSSSRRPRSSLAFWWYLSMASVMWSFWVFFGSGCACRGARNHFRLHKNGTRSRWTIIPMFPRKRSWVEALEFQLDQHFMKRKSTGASAMLQNPAVSPMEALAFRSCIIHIRYVSDSCEQLQDWPSNLMIFRVAQLLDQQQTCLPTSP